MKKFILDKSSQTLELRQKKHGLGVYSKVTILKGDLIFRFEQNFVNKPNNKTLRVSARKHQLSKDPKAYENFVNHSCKPSGFINYRDLGLYALKRIKPGDEITYNYFTSDWDSEDVFECHCSYKKCFKHIKGFKYLSLKDKLRLEKYLSPFLKQKLKKELGLTK